MKIKTIIEKEIKPGDLLLKDGHYFFVTSTMEDRVSGFFVINFHRGSIHTNENLILHFRDGE